MTQIKRVKRKDLDIEKYSNALDSAINYRVYAEHWYLDVLTDEKWECLVYGDYEAIMPIPLQYKLGVKFVLQPIYCQQLGVFYSKEISKELFKAFEKTLHQYRVRAYHFNEENTESFQPEGEKRINYILKLDKSYEEIFANYSKGRRKDVRKAKRLGVQFRETKNPEKFIELIIDNYPHLASYINEDFLTKYCNQLLEKDKIIIGEILNDENELIASQLFIISGQRRICMAYARDREKENHCASAFAKDYLVESLSGQDYTLDFEGSMNENIARFMKGFGVEAKHYTALLNHNLLSINLS